MKIKEEFLEKIEANANRRKKASQYNYHLGLNIQNSAISGATIFMDEWQICTVEELNQMITELMILKDAIEEETGIDF